MHPYFRIKRTGDVRVSPPPKDAIDYVFGEGEGYPLENEPVIISYIATEFSGAMLFRTVTNTGQFLFYKMPLHLYKSLANDDEWAPQLKIKERSVSEKIYYELDVVRYMFLEHLHFYYGSYAPEYEQLPNLQKEFAEYDEFLRNV